jgi:hypothetical protein
VTFTRPCLAFAYVNRTRSWRRCHKQVGARSESPLGAGAADPQAWVLRYFKLAVPRADALFRSRSTFKFAALWLGFRVHANRAVNPALNRMFFFVLGFGKTSTVERQT